MEGEGRRTLSGLVREVADHRSVWGLSRDLAEAPWSQEALVASWLKHFREEMQPQVEAERPHHRQQRLTRRGRPTEPLVTG